MPRNPNVSYRVVRSERVGIGNFDRRLVAGELVDDLPDDILQVLIDGQHVEEVEKADVEAEHAAFVQDVADEAAATIAEHAPVQEDVAVNVEEKPPS